ncbi:class I SAM-dependent methyltransferase [Kribbella yunnanensis]
MGQPTRWRHTQGLEVEGCDMSADMLAMCRRQAAVAGLTPTLYE